MSFRLPGCNQSQDCNFQQIELATFKVAVWSHKYINNWSENAYIYLLCIILAVLPLKIILLFKILAGTSGVGFSG